MSQKPSIEIVEPRLFAGSVADEIVASLQEAIEENGSASIALAGGRTPGSIYRMLGLPPRVGEVAWDKVNIFWGDERWVPVGDKQSNYSMVKDLLLDNVKGKAPKIHACPVTANSPSEGAAQYTELATKVLGSDPVFDLLLLGIGEDGHTASIFPGSAALKLSDGVYGAVPHPSGGNRVTLLPAAICRAKKILFLVSGENKADIVKRVIDGDSQIEELPARIFTKASGRVTFFLDSGAAKKLAR